MRQGPNPQTSRVQDNTPRRSFIRNISHGNPQPRTHPKKKKKSTFHQIQMLISNKLLICIVSDLFICQSQDVWGRINTYYSIIKELKCHVVDCKGRVFGTSPETGRTSGSLLCMWAELLVIIFVHIQRLDGRYYKDSTGQYEESDICLVNGYLR